MRHIIFILKDKRQTENKEDSPEGFFYFFGLLFQTLVRKHIHISWRKELEDNSRIVDRQPLRKWTGHQFV